MKTKVFMAIVIAGVTALAVASSVNARELFVENFEGTPTTEITRRGWTKVVEKKQFKGGSLLITRETVDSGKSATCTGVSGTWSYFSYTRVLRSPYTLTAGETVSLTGVFQIARGTASAPSLRFTGGGWMMIINPIVYPANGLGCNIYRPSGAPRHHEVSLDNSLDPLALDVRIENKAGPDGGVTFSYRQHGSEPWIKAWSVPDMFMTQIDTVEVGGRRRDGPYYVDSLVMSTDLVTDHGGLLELAVSTAKPQAIILEPLIPRLRDQPSEPFKKETPREWRKFMIPTDMRQLRPRPTNAEFLKILPPLRQAPAFDAVAKELGMAIWWGDYSVLMFSEQPPTPEDLLRKPIVRTPPGEDEPIILGLWGLRDVGEVFLLSFHDSPFPVTIRCVQFNPRKVPGDYMGHTVKGARTVGFATFLPEQGTARVEAGKNTVFWINIEVPPETLPGDYKVHLELIAYGQRNQPHTYVPVQILVRVLGFKLPRADIAYGMYFRPYNSSDKAGWDRSSARPSATRPYVRKRHQKPELMRAYWRDMARHGMTSISLYNRVQPLITEDGSPNLDDYRDIENLKNMMTDGLVHPDIPIMVLEAFPTFKKHNDAALSALKAEVKRRNWPEFLIYGPDEPLVNDQVLQRFESRQPWRKNFRLVTALSDRAVEAYGDKLDVWVMHAGHISPEFQKLAAEKGAELWAYSCMHSGRSNFPASRFYAGIYTWALKLKGNFLWNYAGGFNWEGQRYTWTDVVSPSDGGPIPTVEWEGRREGVEDYLTLRLLESLIAADTERSEARKAQAWLEEIRGRVDWFLSRDMPPALYFFDTLELYPLCPNFEPAELPAVRIKAQEYIKSLSRE